MTLYKSEECKGFPVEKYESRHVENISLELTYILKWSAYGNLLEKKCSLGFVGEIMENILNISFY